MQALDLIGRCVIAPRAPLVVENPGYLSALQAFMAHRPTYAPWAGRPLIWATTSSHAWSKEPTLSLCGPIFKTRVGAA